MPKQVIGRVSLKNSGGFVAKIQLIYTDEDGQSHRSNKSGDITLGRTKALCPDELGVPDGADVTLCAKVVLGTENIAKKTFVFKKGDSHTAYYNISGTTLNNDLGLIEVS